MSNLPGCKELGIPRTLCKTKVRNIELLDEEEGFVVSVKGFRYGNISVGSRTKVNDKDTRMCTTRWIEMKYWKEDNVEQVGEGVSTDHCIMNLAGCLKLYTFMVEEGKLNASTMRFLRS